ncbi:MAG: MFS transporter [Daejeonella sp.]|uniref:MFS transporter n=1 Tax=Daejeonella sp. TaxID=2805397 RepID=UPI003C7813F9
MVQTQIRIKLAVFMFLQYVIWGSWYVSMGTYLNKVLLFNGEQIGLAYGAFAIGAMISPFFVGLIADRYFASEKLLAFLGILGGLLLFILPGLTEFSSFYPMLIIYCATFVPTLALGNSISLHHLTNPKRDFPLVKTLSAVGWIAAGLMLSFIFEGEQSAVQFYVAGTVSILFGLFSLTLPHTPPLKIGKDVKLGEILGLDALALLKKPSFAIFIACMFLICIPLYFYFVNMNLYVTELGWTFSAAKMSLAQVSDILFLILLPLMLRTFGYKKTIFIGILGWAVRYFMLAGSVDSATFQTTLVFGAILLHGMCYDFLFIAGQLYVDEEANERIRGAAQGLIAFILWGLGAFVGTHLAGISQASHTLADATGSIQHDWQGIWIYPAWGALAVLVVFMIFFRNPSKATVSAVIAGRKQENAELP